ncbi:hypothetical protein B5S28_g5210 [[Candida] boidinii]|nr:hypothetical protein B5S28_g5210 [[Candida] boidinii]
MNHTNIFFILILIYFQIAKPKPCCVCIPEKQSRDECLLLNGQESGKCDDIIASYKNCMKGFGFEVK